MSNELITNVAKQRKNHLSKDSMNKINQGIPRLEKAFNVQVSVEGTKFQALSSDGVKVYNGDFVENICECADFLFRGSICKHIRAAKLLNEGITNNKITKVVAR